MTKTSNSSTTMRGNPIKANTGKPNAKFPHSIADVEQVGTRLGSKALVPLSTSGVVSTALSNLSSPSMSTSTTTSSMLATQLILTSSTPPCALYFSNSTSVSKKEPNLIDFIDPKDVKSKCLKYLTDADDLPRGQENQLSFLVNKFKPQDIQMAFIKLITIVGGSTPKVFLPIATTKSQIVKDFLCLIYDHKSMMIDSQDVSSVSVKNIFKI
jgi:hypothetical protein